MEENGIAKALRYIGIGIIAVGIIGSLILCNDAKEDTKVIIILVGFTSSFVSGMTFVGFSEIIKLLQQSSDNQEKILIRLRKSQQTTINNTVKNTEQQLPDNKHLLRCANCGEMVEDYPCPKCNFKFN